MRRFSCIGALALCATASLTAQTITLPASAAGIEGSTANNFPWGLTNTSWGGLRIQAIYDSSNLTSQGITGPILITGIKWRCNGGTAPAGGIFAVNTIGMAVAAIDYTAISTTWQPSTVVYSGPVSVIPSAASTPGAWYVGVQISPFLYDPTTGADLLIDTDRPGPANWTGAGSASNDISGAGSLSSRTYGSSLYPNANGITINHGIVVELEYCDPSTTPATFTQFGAGCASALGVPGLSAFASTLPQINSTFLIEVDNIPAPGVAIMITGLNSTNSANFGALPFDGAIAGAPGCFLRVSDDATLLLPGGSPTTLLPFPIPNDPGLLCTTFFSQALVFSPGTNAAGWTISDAYRMQIGQ